MKEIKELEEARQRLNQIFIVHQHNINLVDEEQPHSFQRKEWGKIWKETIEEILNLKGKNWKIAIIGDIKSTYHSDTTDKALKFPIRQIIWEAG